VAIGRARASVSARDGSRYPFSPPNGVSPSAQRSVGRWAPNCAICAAAVGQDRQAGSQVGQTVANQGIDLRVGGAPNGQRTRQRIMAAVGQRQQAAAPVPRIGVDADQAAPLQSRQGKKSLHKPKKPCYNFCLA
jgi:hypothetical protein